MLDGVVSLVKMHVETECLINSFNIAIIIGLCKGSIRLLQNTMHRFTIAV